MVLAGVLGPIEDVLREVLIWLHASGSLSWGWSIVVLTVVVRLVILPLTLKQIRSMQQLQRHAPEMKAIQQKYKNDKKRQQEEVMKFYRENKVNPAASCLPILFQLPVFFSLFYVLRDFEKSILGQPRFEDDDISFLHGIVPNITEDINTHWSGYLLLAVYVGSQLASTYFMSTTMDKRQRMIFLVIPFVAIPFVLRFPTGLMLYWVTTNIWTAGQGLVTRRLIPTTPVALPKRTSKTSPGGQGAEPEDRGSSKQGARPKSPTPTPRPPARASQGSPGQVRRRKKKGPRTRR